MADADQSNLTMLTVDLLSAFVANNSVDHNAIPDLIKSTHAALKAIDSPEPPAEIEPEHKPAVTVRKSLSSDAHIISLIDGKPYQTLKRHLSRHGLTPAEYRERYGLPNSYPMVSKSYSESRRAIAEKLGLGRRVKKDRGEQVSAVPIEDTVAPTLPEPVKPASAQAKRAAKSAPPAPAGAKVAKAPRATAGTPAKVEPAQSVKAKALKKSKAAPGAVAVPTETPTARPARVRKAKAAEPTA